MARKKPFLAYTANCEGQDGKSFSLSVYSNGDVIGPNRKERLHAGVRLTIEKDVKTELMQLYHPNTILVRKRF